MSFTKPLINPIGIGLRHVHYVDFFANLPCIDFVEVHSENFFAQGGAIPQILREVADLYPVSLHGVGLSLGSACGVDKWHLQALKRLVDEFNPLLISDHLCFGRGLLSTIKHPTQIDPRFVHANDLLPIRFNNASLQLLTDNINYVQNHLQRKIGIENIVSYFEFDEQTYSETNFLTLLSQRTGCGLVLDINNIYVNFFNRAIDRNDIGAIQTQCLNYIYALNPDLIMEIHLAGCTPCENGLMIDDHSMPISSIVWNLYTKALQYFSRNIQNIRHTTRDQIKKIVSIPTLIEWDTHLPTLKDLVSEANHVKHIQNQIIC